MIYCIIKFVKEERTIVEFRILYEMIILNSDVHNIVDDYIDT